MTKQEREQMLKEKLVSMQEFERELREKGIRFIGGVDEVGRGPLAGPVVCACVVLPEDFDVLGVDDSKKLSEKKREELYDAITSKADAWAVGMCDNQVIDDINILEATKRAMREAIAACASKLEESGKGRMGHVLIDAVRLSGTGFDTTPIIKGDQKSLSIAAASIVAKVTRDRMMRDYDAAYPGYGFAANKGYGTKEHYEGLARLGITPIHRKTFLKNTDFVR